MNVLQRTIRLYGMHSSPRAWRAALSHIAKRAAGKPVPRFLDIAITYRCQCRCVHCSATSQKGTPGEEMTTAEMKSLLDQARRLGVLEVIFSGGEPLLRPDIVELVRHARDRGLLIRLNTNGLLLDRNLAAELKRAGVTQCAVSIDDADPEVHDRLRGVPGLHAKATEAIRTLREFGIPCQILTYASKERGTAALERIIAQGKSLGAFAVFVFFPMAVGRWDQNYDCVLTEQERAAVRKLIDATFVHFELPAENTMCCTYEKLVFHITARADATPCPFVPLVLGNLRQHSLEELWQAYCANLHLTCRGDCPMNFPDKRREFVEFVEETARGVGDGKQRI